MNDMNKATLDYYVELIDNKLLELTRSKPELQGQVVEAMEYSLQAGGKRLRPVLMLEFCRMCGERQPEKYAEIACSIELIHTFSLIHDDLPCMDDDDYRRGKPGDALNTLAFEVIANSAMNGVISADKAVMLISVLARAVGTDGMIGGQVIDLKYENKEIDVDTLNILQTCKTGALIEAACVMGVILGDKLEAIPFAADYAQAMGRAFQIVDDILDVTGTFEELGKPIGSDSEQHKNTYVSLLGLDKSEQIAKQLTVQALGHLKYFEDSVFLTELTSDMLTRRS